MKKKCPSCGQIACIVTTQRKLMIASIENIGDSGKITPTSMMKSETIIDKFVGWVVGDKTKYIYCEKCGHYEKLQ